MIVISHPTGNEFFRAVVQALESEGMLYSVQTTLSFNSGGRIKLFPERFRSELLRRTYPAPASKIFTHPQRELIRLLALRLKVGKLTQHEKGWASLDAVYRDLDHSTSDYLKQRCAKEPGKIQGVYCYEDGALETFQAARQLGLKGFYDLPIAYWQTSRKLLLEEAQRLPEWEPTLGGTRDSEEKLERKTQEVALCDAIICPSKFVYDTLPEQIRKQKRCIVAEFGTPEIHPETQAHVTDGKLRVLFAGAMTQRKGLADVFQAIKFLRRDDIELIVMGSPVAPLDFYRKQLSNFTHEAPRPHGQVLNLMSTCHALVLPSIVEGRALVQQEAMACGLPIIVTPNAGGEDLIDEGKSGFLVPIRSPEKLAEKISWMADNRSSLPEMGRYAREKASAISWDIYKRKIISEIKSVLEETVKVEGISD